MGNCGHDWEEWGAIRVEDGRNGIRPYEEKICLACRYGLRPGITRAEWMTEMTKERDDALAYEKLTKRRGLERAVEIVRKLALEVYANREDGGPGRVACAMVEAELRNEIDRLTPKPKEEPK